MRPITFETSLPHCQTIGCHAARPIGEAYCERCREELDAYDEAPLTIPYIVTAILLASIPIYLLYCLIHHKALLSGLWGITL